jgi:hypothetical protein
MTKQRLSTADQMSGPAAILAFVACFAVVLSPSFFATLVMVASERPWGFASQAEPTPAAIFPVMQERSEEVRTAAANLPPSPAPDETGRELLQLMPLRPTVGPHTEPAATHPEDPVPVSNPVEPIGVAAPVLAPAAPERDVQQRRHVVERLGFLSVPLTGFPGALQSFREAHQLDAHAAWDVAAERSLFAAPSVAAASFVGIWGADASACSVRLNRKGFLPAVINDEGAFAGDTSCAFKSRKQVAGAWQLVAACANARRRWTSHIRLAVTGNRLIWSSQRGLQTYVRCERGPMMAQASK